MERKLYILGASFGLTAIIFGAFGAHTLKNYLTPEQLTTFETGVRYQMYQALFLLLIASNLLLNNKTKKSIYFLTLIGVLFFSGSIYLLSTKTIIGLNFKPLGIITPIGGVLLIAAWFLLLFNVFKSKK